MNTKNPKFDVVIVGAGAAGIGCGVVLKDLGIENFVILERHQVGASFSRWPEEMRFITPSFPSHGFGLLDLNAVLSSPGFEKPGFYKVVKKQDESVLL
ncbi:MAG: NAD(P)-binding domain-containing protein, partial [Crocosphaera sp.]